MSVQTIAALVFTVFAGRTGQPVAFEAFITDLARSDVVFLGEEHGNTAGHRLQLKILKALHAKRPDLVLSMEMFERDVQGILSDYVRGTVDEKTFLQHARPWPKYEKRYRPLVEFAKKNELDVIAANAPTSVARLVTAGGLDAVERSNHVAGWISAPRDRYYVLFKREMADHPGNLSTETLERFYASQCLKDDTMAESIFEYLRSRPHRQPLVVHVCGSFHSDHGLGTVSRLLARDPLCRVSVTTMEPCEDPKTFKMEDQGERGHYVLAVPEEPKPKKKKEEKEKPDPADVAKEKKEEEAAAEEALEDDEERAALGVMPSYEEREERGVLIEAVTPGKGAEKAGLKDGDVIIGLAGELVVDLNDYMDLMSDFRPGQTIKVKILRGGKEKELKVKLSAYGR